MNKQEDECKPLTARFPEGARVRVQVEDGKYVRGTVLQEEYRGKVFVQLKGSCHGRHYLESDVELSACMQNFASTCKRNKELEAQVNLLSTKLHSSSTLDHEPLIESTVQQNNKADKP